MHCFVIRPSVGVALLADGLRAVSPRLHGADQQAGGSQEQRVRADDRLLLGSLVHSCCSRSARWRHRSDGQRPLATALARGGMGTVPSRVIRRGAIAVPRSWRDPRRLQHWHAKRAHLAAGSLARFSHRGRGCSSIDAISAIGVFALRRGSTLRGSGGVRVCQIAFAQAVTGPSPLSDLLDHTGIAERPDGSCDSIGICIEPGCDVVPVERSTGVAEN